MPGGEIHQLGELFEPRGRHLIYAPSACGLVPKVDVPVALSLTQTIGTSGGNSNWVRPVPTEPSLPHQRASNPSVLGASLSL